MIHLLSFLIYLFFFLECGLNEWESLEVHSQSFKDVWGFCYTALTDTLILFKLNYKNDNK